MIPPYFPEICPSTYFPKGHETFFEGVNRLGHHWFPIEWHGEDECRYRNAEFDDRVSKLTVAGARILLAESYTEDELRGVSDDDIAAMFRDKRASERMKEISAAERFDKLVGLLREALIESKITIVGLAEDGTEIPLRSKFWKGNLATNVLYDGSCTVDSDLCFVPQHRQDSGAKRILIFDSESIDSYILYRTPRIDLSESEVFSHALEWLSREMRKSPSRRPPDMTKAKSRRTFNEINRTRVSERDWKKIWVSAIEDTGATAWSKSGPTKQR